MSNGNKEETEGTMLVIRFKAFHLLHQTFNLKPGEYSVSRDLGYDIVIVGPYISRVHAKIFYSREKWCIEDLGSKTVLT
jgi:pSer/pThr/pTyr-binding forkhead associated (FHA) protein